jgi:hypothetical protein
MSGLPATEKSTGGIMSPGLHRMKILSIKPFVDKSGKELKDKNGNPGLDITFINVNKETINGGFYYSTLPIGDPGRKDDNIRCKSEFLLTNMKKALGFPEGEVSKEQLAKAKCWGIVGLDVHYWNGKPTGKEYSFLAKKFFSDGDTPPAIIGDPSLKQSGGVPSGDFYKRTDDKRPPAGAPAEPEPTIERKEAQPKSDAPAATTNANPDMEIAEDDF